MSCMLKQPEDQVSEGDILAQSKGIFGLFKSVAKSPISGTIDLISDVTGQVLVREEDVVLPEALIRAYILLGSGGYTESRDDPENPARSVVQVAEVRADSEGRFRLLMPQALEGPKELEEPGSTDQ